MNTVIRHRPCPRYVLCGTQGRPLYGALRDRLFGAPGEWDLKQCPDSGCGLIWLDPMPVKEDIALAYQLYYTHSKQYQPVRDTWRRRISRVAGQGYLTYKYGYTDSGLQLRWKWLSVLTLLNPGLRADLVSFRSTSSSSDFFSFDAAFSGSRRGLSTRRVFTTVRDANGAFLASRSIHRSGEYNMGGLQPWNRRLLARGIQLIEWLLLQVFPPAGEEVVMVAEK